MGMRIIGTLAALAALFAGAGAGRAQEVTLRIHHFLPEQAAIALNFMTPWTEKVEQESGGRIRFEVHAALGLGGIASGLVEQVRDGRVDLAWVQLGDTPGRFPRAETFELPFLSVGAEATSKAFQEFYETRMQGEFSDFKVIAVHVHGRGLLHVRGKLIAKLEDLAGLKIRAPTRLMSRLLASLEAIPVGMPVTALPSALERDIVDGAAVPWEATVAVRIAEQTKFHTDFSTEEGLYTSTFAFLMNKRAYQALPANLRAVIDANSGSETAGWAGRVMDEGDVPGLLRARALGNSITFLDAEETGRWRTRATAIEQAWIAEMKARDIDGEELVKSARELIKKHQQQ